MVELFLRKKNISDFFVENSIFMTPTFFEVDLVGVDLVGGL